MDKIKEKGSLYGLQAQDKDDANGEEKPGHQYSQKKNDAELQIVRPGKLLQGKLVFDLYDQFYDEINQVRLEEEKEEERKKQAA